MILSEIDKENVFKIVRSLIPKNADILCLSFTGSRAFGWGSENFDIDIRGVISCKDWWNYVHWGRKLYDINIDEMWALFKGIKSWSLFSNLSNPIYIHPDFDYREFMNICCSENTRDNLGNIIYQKQRLQYDPSPRTGLHTYREIMAPLHFLKTRKLEIDLMEINKEYGLQEINKMRDLYVLRTGDVINWERVWEDIKNLETELEKEMAVHTDVLDIQKIKELQEKTERKFYVNG
jgi:hypothetical protein